ncbi:hypothetical protein HG537_0B01260 [Torulaspora globosa]|uniref:Uncharacterized protein n=1 Tax=Torulaspora globosa TaxID=48254 RepID=A0A7H9HQ60_9SACH|nr:hypothetical protein HG537_0B01260 [Torulaspora sp. CBS 2947]
MSIGKLDVLTPEVAVSLTEKVLSGLVNKNQTEEIEDDRYVNVVSRTQSRFASPLGPDPIVSLEIHPSGKSLAYSRADGSLTVWVMSSASFARCKKLYVANAVGRDRSVCCVSWDSSEMDQLATVCNGSEVHVWAVDERKRTLSKVRTISVGAKLKLHTCAYDPTGRWLLALAKSEEVYLFDARKDHELHSVSDLKQIISNDSVQCLAWNNTGSHLFLGLRSGKLALLELDASNDFKLRMLVDAHRGFVSSIAVDPWGRFVVTGGSDGICVVWDISSMCCSVVIDDLGSNVDSLSIDHLGKCLALCTEKGDLRFYDLNSGKALLSQKMKTSGSGLIARFYPDRTWFISSSKWDILERHFTPSAYTDVLGLWKVGDEKPKMELRNRSVARKPLKRGRENDRNDRGRIGKRESSRSGRIFERR